MLICLSGHRDRRPRDLTEFVEKGPERLPVNSAHVGHGVEAVDFAAHTMHPSANEYLNGGRMPRYDLVDSGVRCDRFWSCARHACVRTQQQDGTR